MLNYDHCGARRTVARAELTALMPDYGKEKGPCPATADLRHHGMRSEPPRPERAVSGDELYRPIHHALNWRPCLAVGLDPTGELSNMVIRGFDPAQMPQAIPVAAWS